MEIDCNIDEFGSKRMAVAALKATSEAPTTFKLVVPKEHARMRLDLFLVKSLPEFSRSRIQQLIRARLCSCRWRNHATEPVCAIWR